MKRIALIPGDGIGVEVMREASKLLSFIAEREAITTEEFDFGAERYLATGQTLSGKEIEDIQSRFDAILLGAMGDPRVPDNKHTEDIVLGLRRHLDLYVNLRPVSLMDENLCPLKGKRREDVQFVIIRENTEGMYSSVGGRLRAGTTDEVAIQSSVNSYRGVERILRFAYEFARTHQLPRVTMVDKSNALRYEGQLWTELNERIALEYPEIESEHRYVDAMAMEMVRSPERFSVIVTNNLFGDILSDLAAELQGGMGVAGSANLHPGLLSMYEPVHGSAPNLQGKGLANPFAMILSTGMMLLDLGWPEWNQAIQEALAELYRRGQVTPDLGGDLDTASLGDAVVKAVEERIGA